MSDIRTQANDHAQAAWNRVHDHYRITGAWSPRLEREYRAAEAMVREIDAIYGMSEAELDALFDATQAELEELAAAEGLPDIPLAVIPFDWTPVEDVSPQLAAYWNRGSL